LKLYKFCNIILNNIWYYIYIYNLLIIKKKKKKVYRYEEGDSVYIGVGHSTEITKVIMSPDQQNIISISVEGAIYIWEFPEQVDLHAFDNIEEEQALLLHNGITN